MRDRLVVAEDLIRRLFADGRVLTDGLRNEAKEFLGWLKRVRGPDGQMEWAAGDRISEIRGGVTGSTAGPGPAGEGSIPSPETRPVPTPPSAASGAGGGA
jgi:hypothetical protein